MVRTRGFSRRDFLRIAAGGATLLATGAGCGSGSGSGSGSPKAATGTTAIDGNGKPTLRIAQWTNYVAGYDEWWDNEYTKRWGERNGVEVVVDHFDLNQLPAHAEAEVASQHGHDLFHLVLGSPAPFEDHVIDHREIIEEVEAKLGKMSPFVARSIFNLRTNKYFGFSDFWAPTPVHYRTDLWDPLDVRPDTWQDVLAGGRRLKSQGHPVGIGMGPDPESNSTLLGLMHGFGASIQDEDANVVINSRATVEAVKAGADIFRSAMTEEVLAWDIASNNRFLISGRGSLIVNPLPAIRALEGQNPELAGKVGLVPVPQGPQGRATPYVVGVYVIWKFSENQEAAKRFLIDLVTDYREPLVQSQYDQVPSFPGSVPDFGALVAHDLRGQPAEKYGFLAEAAEWATNVGHPGHTNAALDEVVKASVISQMFSAAALGEMSAEEAVKAADAKIKPIYDKWRERGKI
jgi:multiple sugar transport system substrate-binding protein